MKNYIFKNNKKNKTRYNKEIVRVLMEGQKKDNGIGSGLGNYLTVEILYNAKISPYKKLGEIYDSKKLTKSLSNSIKYIVKLCFLTKVTVFFLFKIPTTIHSKM